MSYGASVNGVKGKRNRVEGTTRALCRSHNATDQRSHDSTTHSTRGTRPPDCILIRHGEHARTAAADTETAMHHAQSSSSPDSAEGEAKTHRSHGVSSTSLPDRSISRTSRSNPRFISLFPPVLSPRVSAPRAQRVCLSSAASMRALVPRRFAAACTLKWRAFRHMRTARKRWQESCFVVCEIVKVTTALTRSATRYTAAAEIETVALVKATRVQDVYAVRLGALMPVSGARADVLNEQH